MSYRILPDGAVEVDSIEELEAALRVVAGLSRRSQHQMLSADVSETEEERAAACFRRLKPNPVSFLRLLKTRLDGLALDDAPALLGLANNIAVSGVVSVTIRCLKRDGVDPQKVIVTRRSGTGARRKITYSAGPLLMQLSLPVPQTTTLVVGAGSRLLNTQQLPS